MTELPSTTGRGRPKVLVSFLWGKPNELTGISVYTFKILEAFIKSGRYDYTLLTNWDRAAVPEPVRSGLAIETVRIPKSDKLAFPFTVYFNARAARSVGAEVVFTPHPYGALVGGKARVLVLHDLYHVTNGQFFRWDQRLTWQSLFALSLQRSAGVICVSEATRADFATHYPRQASKAVVVHEASPVQAGDGASAAAPARPGYGLIVANASPNKNFKSIIAALAALHRDGLAPRVYWVGRDEFGEVAALRAQYGGLKNFVAVGPVGDEALRSYYRNAGFYINASLVEGFCLPILEAQTFGIPVICSDIPVLREVAGEAGLYFDPQDAEALAAQIRALTTNEGLTATLQKKSRENAAKFSWDLAARETEDVFERAIAAASAERDNRR